MCQTTALTVNFKMQIFEWNVIVWKIMLLGSHKQILALEACTDRIFSNL